MSRAEDMLIALATGNASDIVPRSRLEKYLKNCIEGCGCDGLPAPKSRAEILLYALAEKIAVGGGSTGGGSTGGKSKLVQVLNKSVTEITANDVEGVTSIPAQAFYQCNSLVSMAISSTTTTIGENAMSVCRALETVTFLGNSQLTQIGASAFASNTKLKNVYITDLAAWCHTTFANHSASPLQYVTNFYINGEPITNLEIPNTVTEITSYAFRQCGAITSVTIPSTVTSIGTQSLNGKNITSVTVLAETPPTLSSGAFPSGVTVTVKIGCSDAYKSATNWSALNIVEGAV